MYIVNGKLEEEFILEPESPSFQFGLNVFEGIRGYTQSNGSLKIIGFEEHLERLLLSCNSIGLEVDLEGNALIHDIRKLIKAKGILGDFYLRLIVYSGSKGSWASDDLDVNYIILIRPAQDSETILEDIGISKIRRISNKSMDPATKCGANYINSRYALMEVQKRGYRSALLLNLDGRIAEATGANIFFAKGKVLVTPATNESILCGITRAIVLKMAEAWGFTTEQREIDLEELEGFDAAFLCGTAAQISPIKMIDTRYSYSLAKSREVSLGYNYLKRNLHEFEGFISSVQL